MNLAHAYASVLRENPSADNVKQTLAYMKSRGHLSTLPQVVRILEREKGANEAVVTVARESDVKKFREDIAKALTELGESEHSIAVDPHVVGGYIVRGRSKAIDRTYRKALVSIYQRTIG